MFGGHSAPQWQLGRHHERSGINAVGNGRIGLPWQRAHPQQHSGQVGRTHSLGMIKARHPQVADAITQGLNGGTNVGSSFPCTPRLDRCPWCRTSVMGSFGRWSKASFPRHDDGDTVGSMKLLLDWKGSFKILRSDWYAQVNLMSVAPMLRNLRIQEFDSKWDGILLSVTKIPHDDILEVLYKLRIRESVKLKTVLELYDLETHQKKLGPDYHRLKAMVKRSIEQEIRNKNFGARSGNFEKNAVVKNPGIKQRAQRILGDCWQWEANGQCVKGDNCSFRHDMDKRGKSSPSNPSQNSFTQQSERKPSRTRSPRGKSPSGGTSRWPCKDYLSGTCNNSFCKRWHPPECLFYKNKNGCRFGEKCSFAHGQVDAQPTKWSKSNNDKSAVALLKKGDWHERESVADRYHDSSGKPDKRSDQKLGRNSSKRQLSDARQLGCVFQDMTPPKSILRKSTDMPKTIQRVKFKKAIARHTKIRDQNPSLGYICTGEPHERSPNAPKFEDCSREETEWQELGAREAAWKLAKNVFKFKGAWKSSILLVSGK